MILAGLSGLLAGTVHVVSGPDHLAAVAPLALDSKSGAWRVGLKWGFGHASGVIVIGLLSVLLRGILPIDLLSGWAERFVGIVLIGIGLWGLKRAYSAHVHEHPHDHEETTHSHFHIHLDREKHEEKPHIHTHTAFAIGTIHGLAGSSHFLGVLPALAFPSHTHAVAYLMAYGIGTICSMIIFSSVIGELSRKYANATLKFYKFSMSTLSVVAIGVGIVWLFQ
ncbi:MAG: sulfite exporter TauE/SafE family protein [Verrucomicrobiae bacterium]|nr:sulfite exporter TauE/SafE family protein [Verrucomicrobiae bacterium]